MKYYATSVQVTKDPCTYIPQVGDEFTIEDVSCLEGYRAAKIAAILKLPFLTVTDVMPIPIGEDGSYKWQYEVYSDDFGPFPDWCLQFKK